MVNYTIRIDIKSGQWRHVYGQSSTDIAEMIAGLSGKWLHMKKDDQTLIVAVEEIVSISIEKSK